MEIRFIAEVEAGIDAITDKIEAEILGMIASPTIQDVIRMAYSNGWENEYEATNRSIHLSTYLEKGMVAFQMVP